MPWYCYHGTALSRHPGGSTAILAVKEACAWTCVMETGRAIDSRLAPTPCAPDLARNDRDAVLKTRRTAPPSNSSIKRATQFLEWRGLARANRVEKPGVTKLLAGVAELSDRDIRIFITVVPHRTAFRLLLKGVVGQADRDLPRIFRRSLSHLPIDLFPAFFGAIRAFATMGMGIARSGIRGSTRDGGISPFGIVPRIHNYGVQR